jgi:hypothetical protein
VKPSVHFREGQSLPTLLLLAALATLLVCAVTSTAQGSTITGASVSGNRSISLPRPP